MRERIIHEQKCILRHSSLELAEHWLLALSGLVLVFSGIGELPMYKRFMVTQIPGFSWTGDFILNLKIHYIAAMVFFSILVFHAVYHGLLRHQGLWPRKGDVGASVKTILSFLGLGEEPPCDKYLPEQRLAYAYLGLVSVLLLVTGLAKVIKNFPNLGFSAELVTWMALIHTFATVFFLAGILGHLAALVLKVSRPLLRPMLTGKVDLAYARSRHTLWVQRLEEECAFGQKPIEECLTADPPPAEVPPTAVAKVDEVAAPPPKNSAEAQPVRRP